MLALNGVDLTVIEGHVTGVVGETGSGKSLTSLAVLGMLPASFRITGGRVLFRGEDINTWSRGRLESYRGGQVSIAFQDPKAALNPVFTVGEQLGRVLVRHVDIPRREIRARVLAALERVRIVDPARVARLYPHQLSGGMAQRVMIALATINPADLVILDEPTTGLDVSVQAEVIALLRQLVDELGLTVLLVSHDLGVIGELCDEIAVMYAGEVLESGPIARVLEHSSNPYTLELLKATASVEHDTGRLYSIPGSIADLGNDRTGCPFRLRCFRADERCAEPVVAVEVAPGHISKCHHSAEFGGVAGARPVEPLEPVEVDDR